jgi:hypothetical protein
MEDKCSFRSSALQTNIVFSWPSSPQNGQSLEKETYYYFTAMMATYGAANSNDSNNNETLLKINIK